MEKAFLEIIQKNNLFAGLTTEQIAKLAPYIRTLTFNKNELMVHENDPAADIFIVVSGAVEVLKNELNTSQQHRISTLPSGSVIGELALIDDTPRSASVRALAPTIVLAIAISDLKTLANQAGDNASIHDKIITNLARELAKRLRNTNATAVKSLTNELLLEKKRAVIGRLIINLIITISFYTFALNIISRLTHAAASSTLIVTPIISILAAATYFFIKRNALPLSFYGLTWHGWRKSLLESFLYSLPVLAIIVITKYEVIKLVPAFANLPLFELGFATNNSASNATHHWLIIALPLIYLIFVPIQELVYRGVLQGTFEDFLTGPYKTALAILVADFTFSMTHLHVGLGLALLVFLPGLFWGWLYSRHRTLLGATFSHILIGGFAFFIVGINAFLNI